MRYAAKENNKNINNKDIIFSNKLSCYFCSDSAILQSQTQQVIN